MARRSGNTQMFALAGSPPESVRLQGRDYRLVHVFKHDFFAATCLFEAAGPGSERIVVKFGRSRDFCGLPLRWYAEAMQRHEQRLYRRLEGVEGVPRWVGCVGRTGYAIAYVSGRPLDHLDRPPEGFFGRLGELLAAIHARGVAYCDANKKSNILVRPDGAPALVDYQIAFATREDWPWPLRTLVRACVCYVQQRDIYHLCKHKRRLCPEQLTEWERQMSVRRGRLLRLHRRLASPWRKIRRWFLRQQHGSGRLLSPTAHLETHHQPEKATWRNPE